MRSTPAHFGKGRFVQSSFRILVDAMTPDVAEATVNADALLDWSSVSRVDLQCEELVKCPICLEEELVVPKISRCGHVFCVACVFRYFQAMQEYNGKFMQKCPVCNNQQLTPEELVSVQFEPVKAPREGDRVKLVLARRAVSSTVVRPPPPPAAAAAEEAAGGAPPRRRPQRSPDEAPWAVPVEGEEGWHLSRLARLPPGEFDRMLGEELARLRAYRAECLTSGETELLPSIDAAGTCLAQRRRERADETAAAAGAGPEELQLPASVADVEGLGEEPSAGAAGGPGGRCEASSTGGSVPPSPAAAVPPSPGLGARSTPPLLPAASPATGSTSGGAAPRGNPSHLISFYQGDDGRLIFLQPFFTRFLLHEHGGEWSSLPHYLPEVRIERVQQLSVSDDLRRRHKFLSHLPLGTQICFVEPDLRAQLSKETKEHFAEEFQKIREQRKRDQAKSKHEDRVSKTRADREEEKYYAAFNRPHPSSIPVQVVPTKDDFVPLPGRGAAGSGDAAAAEGDAVPEEEEGESGPTLAEKLKERLAAKARPGDPKRFPRLGGDGAANVRPDDPTRFPALGGGSSSSTAARAAAAAPAAAAAAGAIGVPGAPGSAWGTKLPVAKKNDPQGPVKDCWDDDSDGEERADGSKSFGAALEAALRSSQKPAAAAGAGDGAAGGGEAGEAEAANGSSKKKKGRAGKATTIRLFG